jgi:hypothetical protein
MLRFTVYLGTKYIWSAAQVWAFRGRVLSPFRYSTKFSPGFEEVLAENHYAVALPKGWGVVCTPSHSPKVGNISTVL